MSRCTAEFDGSRRGNRGDAGKTPDPLALETAEAATVMHEQYEASAAHRAV